MSDEDCTGLASITDVDGGAVIKFTGSAEVPVGSVVPRDVSDNTFVVGDVEGSAIVRFLMNGSVNPRQTPVWPDSLLRPRRANLMDTPEFLPHRRCVYCDDQPRNYSDDCHPAGRQNNA